MRSARTTCGWRWPRPATSSRADGREPMKTATRVAAYTTALAVVFGGAWAAGAAAGPLRSQSVEHTEMPSGPGQDSGHGGMAPMGHEPDQGPDQGSGHDGMDH